MLIEFVMFACFNGTMLVLIFYLWSVSCSTPAERPFTQPGPTLTYNNSVVTSISIAFCPPMIITEGTLSEFVSKMA